MIFDLELASLQPQDPSDISIRYNKSFPLALPVAFNVLSESLLNILSPSSVGRLPMLTSRGRCVRRMITACGFH